MNDKQPFIAPEIQILLDGTNNDVPIASPYTDEREADIVNPYNT